MVMGIDPGEGEGQRRDGARGNKKPRLQGAVMTAGPADGRALTRLGGGWSVVGREWPQNACFLYRRHSAQRQGL